MPPSQTPEQPPNVGDLVLVRSRQWLVEEVVQPPEGGSPQVSLACAEDDAGNREGTKRYLKQILEQAIEDAEDRIAVIDGLTSGARRKEIQRRFNASPAAERLRILIATDAAREGSNF